MDSLQVHLDGGPTAAGAARTALREAGVVEGLPEAVRSDVELLVSEVVTNSVRHARTHDVVLGVERDDDRVMVRCYDDGPGFSGARRAPSHFGEGGFGLMLVDRLADRWGIDRRVPGPGCCVWFEVAA
jgi:anti-sigma regulatory factor (Ser/Thr protein kinase)